MNIRNRNNNVEPVHSLKRAEPVKTVDWTFVALATGLTLFFGVLIVLLLTGFKCVESGLIYNNGELILCILGTL